jgi:hypothetical protein
MRVILLVLTVCLFSAAVLSVWMMSAGGGRGITFPDLSLWQR